MKIDENWASWNQHFPLRYFATQYYVWVADLDSWVFDMILPWLYMLPFTNKMCSSEIEWIDCFSEKMEQQFKNTGCTNVIKCRNTSSLDIDTTDCPLRFEFERVAFASTTQTWAHTTKSETCLGHEFDAAIVQIRGPSFKQHQYFVQKKIYVAFPGLDWQKWRLQIDWLHTRLYWLKQISL